MDTLYRGNTNQTVGGVSYPYVPNEPSSAPIPSSGQISFGDFRGTSKEYNVPEITSATTNYNWKTQYDSKFGAGKIPILNGDHIARAKISTNGVCYSNDTNNKGFDVGNFPIDVDLIVENRGKIYGSGGSSGSSGGGAFSTSSPVDLTVFSGAEIKGGGGGGGAGGPGSAGGNGSPGGNGGQGAYGWTTSPGSPTYNFNYSPFYFNFNYPQNYWEEEEDDGEDVFLGVYWFGSFYNNEYASANQTFQSGSGAVFSGARTYRYVRSRYRTVTPGSPTTTNFSGGTGGTGGAGGPGGAGGNGGAGGTGASYGVPATSGTAGNAGSGGTFGSPGNTGNAGTGGNTCSAGAGGNGGTGGGGGQGGTGGTGGSGGSLGSPGSPGSAGSKGSGGGSGDTGNGGSFTSCGNSAGFTPGNTAPAGNAASPGSSGSSGGSAGNSIVKVGSVTITLTNNGTILPAYP